MTPNPNIMPEQQAYRQSAASRQMGAPPPRIQNDVPVQKQSPRSNYKDQVVVKSAGPKPKNTNGFWTPQIIETHQHVPSYFELTSKYAISPQEDQKMSMDRYYSIS